VLLANIPVIFMTAKVLPAEISQFLELGAIGVIVKPFDPLTLYGDLSVMWSNRDGAPQSSIPRSGSSKVQPDLNSLTISFLQRAWADVIKLAKLLESAKNGDRSAFKEIERVSHSLHGAGALFGFPGISEVGAAIERKVEGLTGSAETQSAACELVLLQQLLEFSRQLAQEVEAAWQGAPQSAGMFQGPVGAR
jgi:CheY-like chemotaxis protein